MSKCRFPRQSRREPVEDLHPGRHRDHHRGDHEEAVQEARHPDREHVVRPHEHREEADRDRREGDRLVAEDRLAREDGEDLRDDPHHRQDHDVDLGVPEEPEGVLVEDGAAAVGRDEEAGVELAVEQQQRQPGRQRRQDDDQQRRVDLDRPDEQRQARPAHPVRAQVVDRDDEVDRPRERGDREDVERRGSRGPGRCLLSKQSSAGSSSSRCGRRRRSRRTRAAARCRRRGRARRERVQARERHVAGADHQRHEVVGEAGQDRDDDEEDHRRAVHREELVVAVALDEVVVRLRELRADQQRHDPAGQEEEPATRRGT